MLAYAFQILKQGEYAYIDKENFENIEDLFAEILFKAISRQLKQGLYREYISQTDDIPLLKGKVNICGTMNNLIHQRQLINCEFDELSKNNFYNRILKTSLLVLFTSKIKLESYKKLKMLLMYFNDVDIIHPKTINWRALCFQKNNQTYEILMNICYFILHNAIYSDSVGQYKMPNFMDEHMNILYEKFILEYYKQEYADKLKVRSAQIQWDISNKHEVENLPVMQSDVFLESKTGKSVLIIDAKYYKHVLLSNQFDKSKMYSDNLYQIYAYITNERAKRANYTVNGMLLYAKTGEEKLPNETLKFNNGQKIIVRILDLAVEWKELTKELDNIVNDILCIA